MKLSQVCEEANRLVAKFQSIKQNDDNDDDDHLDDLDEDYSLIYHTQEKVRESLNVFNDALEKYNFNELSISYNGGKDCLVMLIIYLSSLYNHFTSNQLDQFDKIQSIYINYETQFPELLNFIKISEKNFNLNLFQITMSLKEGFQNYLSNFPQVKAIIVGTRRSDPFSSNLNHFQKTDHDWPIFMRIHPVINWHYDEIWCFLRKIKINYCELYDKGFTSLGGIDTTIRNPILKLQNGEYLPAYKLKGDEKERDGRNVKK